MTKLERLLAKVALPDGCWLWKGSLGVKGYGRLRTGSRERSRVDSAHRLMWEAVHGSLLPGTNVLHHCDTPACVRPDHLYVGTHADNARDRDTRARNTRAKLTADQVRLMRSAYRDGWTLRRLAVQFEVSDATVHAIVNGKAWKHVV